VSGDEIIIDAEAVFSITGVAGTGAVNTVTVVAKSVVVPVGVEGDIITDSILVDGDEVIIDAEAVFSITGVIGTTAFNTVTTDCQAVVIPTGVQGTFTVGNETVNVVQFDYEAIKDNYSRDRTTYIGDYTSRSNTVYVRAA
jgi:hypothetical protein